MGDQNKIIGGMSHSFRMESAPPQDTRVGSSMQAAAMTRISNPGEWGELHSSDTLYPAKDDDSRILKIFLTDRMALQQQTDENTEEQTDESLLQAAEHDTTSIKEPGEVFLRFNTTEKTVLIQIKNDLKFGIFFMLKATNEDAYSFDNSKRYLYPYQAVDVRVGLKSDACQPTDRFIIVVTKVDKGMKMDDVESRLDASTIRDDHTMVYEYCCGVVADCDHPTRQFLNLDFHSGKGRGLRIVEAEMKVSPIVIIICEALFLGVLLRFFYRYFSG